MSSRTLTIRRDSNVFKRYVLAGSVAALCAGSVGAAQTTAPGADPQAPGQPSAIQETRSDAERADDSVTLVGCLYREADVPGRTPNVVERAGILEDYILVGAMATAAEQQPGAQTDARDATPGAVGTSGTAHAAGSMFKLEHVADDRLSELVGKRVEVTGKIDAADRSDFERPVGTSGDAPAAEPQPGQPEVGQPEIGQPDAAGSPVGDRAGQPQVGQPQPDRNPLSPDDINLPEFEVASISEVDGMCPASPSADQPSADQPAVDQPAVDDQPVN